MKNKLGVIVGRFQSPTLTEGHRHLIKSALEKSEVVLVFVGKAIVRAESTTLPSFMVVDQINEEFPLSEVVVKVLNDKELNKEWVASLDKTVDFYSKELKVEDITYYGSRDSFLKTYEENGGKNKTEFISEIPNVSASQIRAEIKPKNTVDFKEGMFYTVKTEFNAHYAVVDAVITDGENVLIGKKGSQFCLIGGFADAEDDSLEAAALRETMEETGLDGRIGAYIGSYQCKDWRYYRTRQPFTTAFIVYHHNGLDSAKAADDIDDLKIVPITELRKFIEKNMSGTHKRILETFLNNHLHSLK